MIGNMKRLLKIIGGLAIIYIALCVGYALSENNVSTPHSIGATITQDPTLVADAVQLGLDYSNVNLSFAPTLHASDIADDSKTIGVFHSPNTITIKSGLTKDQEINIVAYEFMHYYWQNLPKETKTNLTNTYQTYYDSNLTFRQLTALYVGSPETLADERNSNACTRTPPYVLTDEFNTYCNTFIPNRSILF